MLRHHRHREISASESSVRAFEYGVVAKAASISGRISRQVFARGNALPASQH